MTILLYALATVAAVLLATRVSRIDRQDPLPADPLLRAFARFCWTLVFTYLGFTLYLLPGLDLARYLSVAGACFLPLTLLQLLDCFFDRPPSRIRPQLAVAAPLVAVAFPVVDLLFYRDVPHASPPEIVAGIYIFGGLLLPLRRLWTLHATSEDRVERARLRYLFALTATAVGFSAVEAVARVLGATPGAELPFLVRSAVLQGAFPPLGAIFTVFLLYFLFQVITVHRLLDLAEIFSRIAVVSVAGVALVAMDALSVAELMGAYRFYGVLQAFVASCLFLLAWDPLKPQLEALFGRVFNRRGRALDEAIAEVDAALARVLSPDAFAGDVVQALVGSGRVTSATLYLWDESRRAYALRAERAGGAEARKPTLLVTRAFAQGFANGVPALVRDALARRVARAPDAPDAGRLEVLDAMGADLVVPFRAGDVILGWLGLRDEDEVEAFAGDEVRRLAACAARAATVLETLREFEKLRDETRLEALGTMAAGLAHEIRNPLAGIKGAAQYLHVGREGPDAEMVQVIIDEVDRLDGVVRQFLDYARPFRGGRDPVDVARVVRRAVQVLERIGLPDGVRVEMVLEAGLPEVPGDAGRLQQVLLNLCQNGVQAMRAGGGALRVRARLGTFRDPKARGAEALEVVVEDEGVGIAQEDIDHLFVPFWTTRAEGTGLGLAISRRIVQAHGGELDVRSEVGRGSAFTVRLPLVREDPGTDEVPSGSSRPVPTTSATLTTSDAPA